MCYECLYDGTLCLTLPIQKKSEFYLPCMFTLLMDIYLHIFYSLMIYDLLTTNCTCLLAPYIVSIAFSNSNLNKSKVFISPYMTILYSSLSFVFCDDHSVEMIMICFLFLVYLGKSLCLGEKI